MPENINTISLFCLCCVIPALLYLLFWVVVVEGTKKNNRFGKDK